MVKSQVNMCPKEEWLNSLWWGFQGRVPLREHGPAVLWKSPLSLGEFAANLLFNKKKNTNQGSQQSEIFWTPLLCLLVLWLAEGYASHSCAAVLFSLTTCGVGCLWSHLVRKSVLEFPSESPGLLLLFGCGFFFITENLIKSIWPSSQKNKNVHS